MQSILVNGRTKRMLFSEQVETCKDRWPSKKWEMYFTGMVLHPTLTTMRHPIRRLRYERTRKEILGERKERSNVLLTAQEIAHVQAKERYEFEFREARAEMPVEDRAIRRSNRVYGIWLVATTIVGGAAMVEPLFALPVIVLSALSIPVIRTFPLAKRAKERIEATPRIRRAQLEIEATRQAMEKYGEGPDISVWVPPVA